MQLGLVPPFDKLDPPGVPQQFGVSSYLWSSFLDLRLEGEGRGSFFRQPTNLTLFSMQVSHSLSNILLISCKFLQSTLASGNYLGFPVIPAKLRKINSYNELAAKFCKKSGEVSRERTFQNLGNQNSTPTRDPLDEMNIWEYFAVNWLIRFGRTRGVFENSLPNTIVFPNRLSSTLAFTLVCSDVDGS